MNKAQKKPLQLQDSLAVRILICVLFPLIAFAGLLLSQGKSPLVAYQTIITSIFGSAYGFGEVIVRAAYLILTGLAASIPARVGLANAGGEGQMAIAALGTAVAGSTVLANLPGVIGIPPYIYGKTVLQLERLQSLSEGGQGNDEIGRASCRERVCLYV